MVYMEDSERAAKLAKESGIDVGLHFNLSQPFTAKNVPELVRVEQAKISRFLRFSKYAQLVYNPFLKGAFKRAYRSQLDEFTRLYGGVPSHVDGHQHMHLCLNVLIDEIIPEGARVRRSFSFAKGEKGFLNRTYRSWIDRRLARKYFLTDYFFGLSSCLKNGAMARVAELAKRSIVELMTHAGVANEYSYLMSESFASLKSTLRTGSFSSL